jgi:hypothetical protein
MAGMDGRWPESSGGRNRGRNRQFHGGPGHFAGPAPLSRLIGMALEMRPECERCHAALGPQDAAFICSYECTFCPACAEAMAGVCPNCGGVLENRPTRVTAAAQS